MYGVSVMEMAFLFCEIVRNARGLQFKRGGWSVKGVKCVLACVCFVYDTWGMLDAYTLHERGKDYDSRYYKFSKLAYL